MLTVDSHNLQIIRDFSAAYVAMDQSWPQELQSLVSLLRRECCSFIGMRLAMTFVNGSNTTLSVLLHRSLDARVDG